VTWLQHFVFALPAIFFIVTEPPSSSEKLTRWLLGFYVILALVINRELVGKENYLLLLSYHTHTLCLLLLFALVMVHLSFSKAAQQQLMESSYKTAQAA
jgi:hypothetical protein